MQYFDFSLIADTLATEAADVYEMLVSIYNGAIGPVRYLGPENAAEVSEESEYEATGKDERVRAMKQIALRRGQQQFRQTLRARYGDRCLVSGCTLVHALEAAHIHPYRGENENHPDNGLLLRADLHTLFDLDLIGINPQSLAVTLHPSIVGSGYDEFEGNVLLCGVAEPSKAALAVRWAAFETRRSETRALAGARNRLIGLRTSPFAKRREVSPCAESVFPRGACGRMRTPRPPRRRLCCRGLACGPPGSVDGSRPRCRPSATVRALEHGCAPS